MITNKEKAYGDELFKRLKDNPDLKKEQEILASFFKEPIWWIAPCAGREPHISETDIIKQCREMRNCTAAARSKCMKVLINAFCRAKDTKQIQFFKCIGGFHGFVFPVAQGNKIYCYVAMCRAEREIPVKAVEMFTGFLNTLMREVQKELELTKLYETLRPRAIALSTVHTVHRLISSTLDLDELLPRIARLSLHVVRANRCSIKLVDKTKKVLLPKTTIDLRKKKVRLKKVKVGMYAPGRAFKNAKVVRGKDYLAIPLIDEDAIGVITLYDKVDGKPFSPFDQEIMQTLAEQAVIAIKNAQLYKERERLTIGTIKSLALILKSRSPYRAASKSPFIKIAVEMGRELKLRSHELRSLEYATLLHDAGEIIVPDDILTKPSRLTGKEYKLVKEHPLRGVKIFKPLKALKDASPIILHHHEKYDGTGYPKGLKGNRIPLGARIMALVAAFEAMIARRPYRAKKSIRSAVEEIKKNSGTQFDPKMVEVFLKVIRRRHIRSLLKKEGHGA